ncbi:MAG: L-seryl-tRNA(Sec) selenium transferase, partial [Anaerolineae bacterium]|nr:L-seryl-tRNA(Sec) selenium transferase [Anaerolineae bacterium]
MTPSALRQLPSVDRILNEPTVQALLPFYGHRLVVTAIRRTLDDIREEVRAGGEPPPPEAILARAAAYLQEHLAPTLKPVINATGVVIHTNLGRAPLSAAARAAMDGVARGYSNLEYDLAAGRRGHRTVHAERLLCELTGAEAALVVNNNAGAVLLALTVMARGKGVLISRGQLIEIGGGFRIPEVMAQSGARLVEVGTTN